MTVTTIGGHVENLGPGARYWRSAVVQRADLAETRLEVRRGLEPAADDKVRRLLTQARKAAGYRSQPLRFWCNPADQAWLNLHAAEVILALHTPEPLLCFEEQQAQARLRRSAPADDPRRVVLESLLTTQEGPAAGEAEGPVPTDGSSADERRVVIAEALRLSFSAEDEHYARVRSFATIVWLSALALIALSVMLGVVGYTASQDLPLCFDLSGPDSLACPTGSERGPWDTALVGLFGSIGGAIAAVYSIRRLSGSSSPYAVPLSLAVLKLPLGAITAIVGLVLVNGGVIPGLSTLETPAEIMAYAVLLGYSQQVVTGMVDEQAQRVLSSPNVRANETASLIRRKGGTVREGTAT